VPAAAPRYSSLVPGLMKMLSKPPRMPAATLERKGFHTRYSVFVPSSPYWEREVGGEGTGE